MRGYSVLFVKYSTRKNKTSRSSAILLHRHSCEPKHHNLPRHSVLRQVLSYLLSYVEIISHYNGTIDHFYVISLQIDGIHYQFMMRYQQNSRCTCLQCSIIPPVLIKDTIKMEGITYIYVTIQSLSTTEDPPLVMLELIETESMLIQS